MSDYLKHLAARGLNRAPSVQPRLASRFEPLSLAAAPFVSDLAPDRGQPDLGDDLSRHYASEAHDAPTHTESRWHAADTEPVVFDASPFSDARHKSRTHSDAGHTPVTTASKLPDQSSPSSIFIPSPGQERARTSSQTPGEVERTSSAQASEDARMRLQNKDDTHARRPPATNESALERSIRRIVAGEFEARDAQADDEDSPRAPGRSGNGTHPAVVPVSIVAARANAATKREQADASAPTSPPVIRVTIGRIEVRAVAPPAAGQRGEARGETPADARPDPARSLREYLKQRSGGKP
ncbi:MAG TPA: hypothetical protein VK388_10045 [Pyrinomonadaceae bacterium]|nr:hypothetical protein [Pyrinomonadaceae bacterium]